MSLPETPPQTNLLWFKFSEFKRTILWSNGKKGCTPRTGQGEHCTPNSWRKQKKLFPTKLCAVQFWFAKISKAAQIPQSWKKNIITKKKLQKLQTLSLSAWGGRGSLGRHPLLGVGQFRRKVWYLAQRNRGWARPGKQSPGLPRSL